MTYEPLDPVSALSTAGFPENYPYAFASPLPKADVDKTVAEEIEAAAKEPIPQAYGKATEASGNHSIAIGTDNVCIGHESETNVTGPQSVMIADPEGVIASSKHVAVRSLSMHNEELEKLLQVARAGQQAQVQERLEPDKKPEPTSEPDPSCKPEVSSEPSKSCKPDQESAPLTGIAFVDHIRNRRGVADEIADRKCPSKEITHAGHLQTEPY